MRIWAFPAFYPYKNIRWQNHGIFAHRQYKGLIANGAELTVVLPVMWSPPRPFHLLHDQWKKLQKVSYPDMHVYDGIEVYHPRIANMKPSRLFSKTYADKYIDSIIGFFKEHKITLHPDTDIFYSQWLPDAYMVQKAARKLGVKSAVLAIGDDVNIIPHKNKAHFDIITQTWKEADYRIVVAGYLGNEANKLIQQDLPYHIVRRGVEYDKFVPVSEERKQELRKELKLPTDKLIILMVGSSNIAKGWRDLFDAVARLKEHNSNFVLVGVNAGVKEIELKDEAQQRGITDIYIDLGPVPPEKINQLYNACDIFCLPSHTEGIANVVVEAMSCGIPVVTTTVGGHPELVVNGSNGILIPPKKPDILYEELLKLMNDKERRQEIGATARNFIINEWGSFKQNAGKLYNILASAVKK